MPQPPPDNHPATVYLDTLTTEISRRAIQKALNEMAGVSYIPCNEKTGQKAVKASKILYKKGN